MGSAQTIFAQAGLRMISDEMKADALTSFHDKEMRLVMEEVRDLWNDLLAMNERDDAAEMARAMEIYQYAYFRNIRIIFAYMRSRLVKIRECRWEHGSMLPNELLERFNETERTYYQRYNDEIDRYMKVVTDPNDGGFLDLTIGRDSDAMAKVETRVIAGDGDEIFLDSGAVIRLEPGDTLYLLKSDVMPLVRSGNLTIVSGRDCSVVMN